MIIRIATDHTISIEDRSNFRKFKLACDLPESSYRDVAGANPGTVSFDDARTAWVSIAALQGWDGLAGDQSWLDGLAAMIKAAEPHGWISPDKRSIKAHVDWAS